MSYHSNIDHQKINDSFSEIHTTKSLNLFFNLYIYAAHFCILCFKMEGYGH